MSDDETTSSEGDGAEEEEDLEWKPLEDFNEEEEERLDEIFGEFPCLLVQSKKGKNRFVFLILTNVQDVLPHM